MHFTTTGMMNCEAEIHIPGYFSVYNALTTMTVCKCLGIEDDAVLAGLASVQVKGRVEPIPVSKDFSVIIDYAHNEVSTRSVLQTLKAYEPGRLIALFGCGGNRSKVRRYDIGEVAGELADLCILTSDNPRFEKVSDIIADIKIGLAKSDGKYIEIEDRREAIAHAITHAEKGDMIVLLGKGHEDYIEIEGVKHHFSEHEVIAEIVEEIKAGKRQMVNCSI
jgi:UDP-N-acetylmuramoyl-L-alanyl-D-glutamate--2,6-diaminopimelate ligase